MKRQYLGDSRDSFKWDYHDFLASRLGAPELQVVWMMTPDDGGGDGKTAPEWFPARREVLDFCNALRRDRDPRHLARLPAVTDATYSVRLIGTDEEFSGKNRETYFAKVVPSRGVVFLDPDNGLEPEKSCSEKHVKYSEIEDLVNRMSPESVISVFQHFRRKPFAEDFAQIRERLGTGLATAIYWHSLMFVAITRSEAMRKRVLQVNREYAKGRPVVVLD